MDEHPHTPVMVREVLESLQLRPGAVYVDATVGYGGHAAAVADVLAGTGGCIVGIDQDPDALAYTRQRLADSDVELQLVRGNFSELDSLLSSLQLRRIDGILFDLGVSSPQLDEPERGFSFRQAGPLDSRMDPDASLSMAEIVNTWSEEELERVLREYGDERYAKRIAQALVRERHHHPLQTTQQLAEIVVRAYPARRRHGRIHCASRTFLALRIAANRELEHLLEGLGSGLAQLTPGGRLAVLSYHSGEDRIVKRVFRQCAGRPVDGAQALELPACRVNLVTRRPLVPEREEIEANRRARSAKLRVVEKCETGHSPS